jgi:hypothetical protein
MGDTKLAPVIVIKGVEPETTTGVDIEVIVGAIE